MRAFAAAWPKRGFVQQAAAQIPWFHNLLRHPYDQPTIGLLLCRGRNRIVAEYALRHLKRPVGVAEWETRLVEKLPKALAGSLPTVKEIEAELVEVAKPAPKKRGRQASISVSNGRWCGSSSA